MSVINDNVLMRFAVLFPFRTTTKRYKICFTLFFFRPLFHCFGPGRQSIKTRFFLLFSSFTYRGSNAFLVRPNIGSIFLPVLFCRSIDADKTKKKKERKKLNSCERDRSRQGKTEKKKRQLNKHLHTEWEKEREFLEIKTKQKRAKGNRRVRNL